MSESEEKKIGATTQAGKLGKKDKESTFVVKHVRPGVTITFDRNTKKGGPFWVSLALSEAIQLVAELARAVETETLLREQERREALNQSEAEPDEADHAEQGE